MKKFLTRYLDRNLLRLYGYFLSEKANLLMAAVFLIAGASTSSIIATLLGKLADAGFYEEQSVSILTVPALLIGVSLFFAVCTVASAYLMARVTQKVLIKIRMQLFTKFLHWPESHYGRYKKGTVAAKFVNEANIALQGATNSVIVLIRDSVQVIALLAMLFYHNWFLTLVSLVVGPVMMVMLRAISKRMHRAVLRSQESIAEMVSTVQETYHAQRLVKLGNTYEIEAQRFEGVNEKIRKIALKMQKTSSLGTPVVQVLTMVGVSIVVAVALYQVQQEIITIGAFVSFLSAMLLLMRPVQLLAGLSGTFASISAAASSVFGMMDEPVEHDNGEHQAKRTTGHLCLQNVTFQYPGQSRSALESVTLDVSPGTTLALVGHSGSGKTSLIQLIARYWEPTSGKIILDGVDLKDWQLDSLRSQMAFVTQDVVLFDDTIRNNITYGLEQVDNEKLEQAIHAAALDEFIAGLPQGLDTRVGEGGSLLSGGQKQRISIARAFLRDTPIVILDEPTSALDAQSEAQIKEALNRLAIGRTCIVVAHRLSTISDASQIIVLDHGKIQEVGTFDELMRKGQIFYKMYKLQKE